MNRRSFLSCATGVLAASALPDSHEARADTPTYRLIVPFAAGGGTDIIARALVEHLRSSTGGTWVVENVAGANGGLGAAALARSEPDGRTVSMFSPGIQITNELLYDQLPYDPVKDFAPVVMVAKLPNLLVVNNALPVKSVSELIAYAKANPGKLNFSSSGKGASSHLAAELFMQMAGVKMTHVPYKGSAPGLVDLMAGRVDLTFDSMTVLFPKLEGSPLRMIAVTTEKRLAYLPDVPAISETLPGFEGSSMVYMAARAGTPDAQIKKINDAFNYALTQPGIVARYKALGLAPPNGGSPAELRAIIASERAKWKRVIEATGLTKSSL